MEDSIRILIAKPGLDGHDRGAKVIVRALREAGMEVVYTGLRQTPDMIVAAAIASDVDVIGLSVLSGAHNTLVPRIIELLIENNMEDMPLFVGGIIPDEDRAGLLDRGVWRVFGPGSRLDDIADAVREAADSREAAERS